MDDNKNTIEKMKKSSQSRFLAIVLAVIIFLLLAWKQGWIPKFPVATEIPTSTPNPTVYTEATRSAAWKTFVNNDYGFEFKYPQTFFLDSPDNQPNQLNSDVSPGATYLSVNYAKFSTLVDNKETCTNGICSRRSPKDDQLIINQASVGDEIKTNAGLPGKVVSIGGVKGFRYLGYNPQAKAYSTGVVVYNSQVDRIELSMSIVAPNETQAGNDKLNKDFDQIISTFKFTK